ncbi:MerR family transcriptional regulator [Halomonas organivorans]|uniref:DNA-binding transcriptional MerR regulator n=1 Tax=Halomonas organivorans TaxID=257772 RepID=A0A7W5G501_9GAMM|nr:MerR family DNA-binding transcriptional regulator [Halomonas organivorans]MBB3140913.1 DNA-binding transcriptional MerR regulator [Halomonas organivorans]
MQMKIGELAERTGLATSRIRYYERIGLLTTVERTANGYRTYPPEAETVLNLILKGQAAGFSLDELHKLIPKDLTHWDHDSLLEALYRKVADIESLEKQLARSKEQVRAVIADIETKPDDIDCKANAKRVLSRFGLGDTTEAAHDTSTESST